MGGDGKSNGREVDGMDSGMAGVSNIFRLGLTTLAVTVLARNFEETWDERKKRNLPIFELVPSPATKKVQQHCDDHKAW